MITLILSFFIVAAFSVLVYGWYGWIAVALLLFLLWYSTGFAKPSKVYRIMEKRLRSRSTRRREDRMDHKE